MIVYSLIVTFILGGITFLMAAVHLAVRAEKKEQLRRQAAHPSTMSFDDQAELALREILGNQ